MVEGRMRVVWISLALLALASAEKGAAQQTRPGENPKAGPLHRFPREIDDYQNDLSVYANYTANEVCFSEGEVFQKGDMMPNPGPCEECRCEPPSIVCNMIKCPVNNNGCRTVQRSNHCCPDYNCECDYNGQLYNDGERLELPEEPCQVCYCKGGEVMCTSITCYHRDDCDPIQVPGQCCPKYENCPLRDMGAPSSEDKNTVVRSTNKTNHVSPKRDMTPWLLTKVPQASSSSAPKQPLEPTTEGANLIIVSDWLTERRTTTEDATSPDEDFSSNSTDEPELFTGSDHLTTIYGTSIQYDVNSDGPMIVKSSETITPVDEVIFTRIDMPKENQEENSQTPTSNPSELLKNNPSTGLPGNAEIRVSDGTTDDGETTEILPHLTAQDEIGLQNENLGVGFSTKESTLHEDLNISTRAETTDALDNKEQMFNKTKKIEQKEPESQGKLPDGVSLNFPNQETRFINTSVDNNGNNAVASNSTSSTHLTEDQLKNIEGSEDSSPEHLFGLDESRVGETEQESTTEDELEMYTTERLELVTIVNEFTDNSLEDQAEEESKPEKFKISLSGTDTTSEGSSDRTTNILIETDQTTPYFTEDHVGGGNDAGNPKKQSELTEDKGQHTTQLAESKKENFLESKKSNMKEALNKSDQKNETSASTYNSVEEGIDSTTESTKTFNLQAQNEIKTKRHNLSNLTGEESSLNSSDILSSPENTITSRVKVEVSDLGTEMTVYPEVNTLRYNLNFNQSPTVQNNIYSPSGIENPEVDLSTPNFNDDSVESKEVISDAPPVLELNSHVPFLQLGGHGNLDSAINTFEETHQAPAISNDNVEHPQAGNKILDKSTMHDSDSGAVVPKQDKSAELSVESDNTQTLHLKTTSNTDNDRTEPETTTNMIFTSSHIPLTPGDLKMLAEYLINDTIKTVPVKNISEYVPNQWLKGNLTSEEKIASIFSAANVSIAIMNQTDDMTKTIAPETTTRVNDILRIDKLDKDKHVKGNSLYLGNSSKISKSKEYIKSPKIKSESEFLVNDEAQLPINSTVSSPHEVSTASVNTSTEPPGSPKHEIMSIKNISAEYGGINPEMIGSNANLSSTESGKLQSTVSQGFQTQNASHSKENHLYFDHVNPVKNIELDRGEQNNSVRTDKISNWQEDETTSASTVTVTYTGGDIQEHAVVP